MCVLPTKEKTRQTRAKMDPGFQMLFTGTKLGSLNEKEKAFLALAYQKSLVALK